MPMNGNQSQKVQNLGGEKIDNTHTHTCTNCFTAFTQDSVHSPAASVEKLMILWERIITAAMPFTDGVYASHREKVLELSAMVISVPHH